MKTLAVLCLLAGLSSASVLRAREDSCNDKCGKYWHDKSVEQDQAVVTSDCQSFLITTIIPAPVTVTATTTKAQFDNNPGETTTLTGPATVIPPDATQTGVVTMIPTAVPTYADSHCKCDGCNWSGPPENVMSQYKSVCKCAGATETNTEVPTPTVTVTVIIPTKAATFKIRVNFENGTYTYLDPRPYNVAGGEWVSAVDMGLSNTTETDSDVGAQFIMGDKVTLEMINPSLVEYERTAPGDATGTPQLMWFVDPKVANITNSRPFALLEMDVKGRAAHVLVPGDGGKGYTEFMLCESCGNQMFIATGAYKKAYLDRAPADKSDIYDWVTLEAEPIL